MHAPHHPNDSDLDEKHQFEDEAEEDMNFIDDGSEEGADESDDDAAAEVRDACAALRNRGSWKTTQASCPMCADLRAVLGHLLGLQ